jgi:predicted nucleic acid-binding protein
MILVDSSVWIDDLRGTASPETILLDALIDTERLAIGDLIFLEVLRGTPERSFATVRKQLLSCAFRELSSFSVITAAAENNRALRSNGATVRNTIDLIIGSYCLLEGLSLLHKDRDVEPFERHLGLQVYRGGP